MKKNIYEKPGMVMVNLQHQRIICSSDAYGVNRSLQDEEVDDAWVKENSGSGNVWDDEW